TKRGSEDSGQVLVLAVLGMIAILGFVAMAIDVGLIFEDRRGMQNSADAAALAGVSALPINPAGAILQAKHWAELNGFPDGQNGTSVKVVTPYNADPNKIEVTISRPRTAIFARGVGQ